MRSWILTLAVALVVPAVAYGDITYLDDDFNADLNGWAPYSNAGQQTQHGHPGAPYHRTNSGIYGWNPPVSPPGGAGWEAGLASVFDTGYGYSGITKQFQDEFLPEQTKYFEITYRAIAGDYGGVPQPYMTVWMGLDPTGGTDRAAGTVQWSQLLTNPPGGTDWRTDIVTRPCEEALETLFIEVRWTFINGYNVFDIDHVKVWQTPEPASATLLLVGGLPLLLRRRRS